MIIIDSAYYDCIFIQFIIILVQFINFILPNDISRFNLSKYLLSYIETDPADIYQLNIREIFVNKVPTYTALQ